MKRLLLALQFLTIIPVRVSGQVTERDLSGSAAFFPLVGAFQGLLAVCSCWVFLRVFPPEIAAGLIIVVLIIGNGGFHMDGLADTFDALAVKSGGDREADRVKRLAVMKDSFTGAIGVTTIVLVVLLKFLLVNSLLAKSRHSLSFAALFLMPVLSKWAMVSAISLGTPAREDGLAKIFLDNRRRVADLTLPLLTVLTCMLATVLGFGGASVMNAAALSAVLFSSSSLFSFLSVKLCMFRFGGLTGDNFGAIGELSEILFLMVVIVWFRGYFW